MNTGPDWLQSADGCCAIALPALSHCDTMNAVNASGIIERSSIEHALEIRLVYANEWCLAIGSWPCVAVRPTHLHTATWPRPPHEAPRQGCRARPWSDPDSRPGDWLNLRSAPSSRWSRGKLCLSPFATGLRTLVDSPRNDKCDWPAKKSAKQAECADRGNRPCRGTFPPMPASD